MPGMEYVLGAGHCTFALFGALTVSDVLYPLVIFYVLFVLIAHMFGVGVLANLKDVKYDSKQGIKTTPMILGVTAIDDELRIPAVFTAYAFSIKGIQIGIALLPFLTGDVSMFLYGIPVPIICFSILSTLLIYTLWKILSTSTSNIFSCARCTNDLFGREHKHLCTDFADSCSAPQEQILFESFLVHYLIFIDRIKDKHKNMPNQEIAQATCE